MLCYGAIKWNLFPGNKNQQSRSPWGLDLNISMIQASCQTSYILKYNIIYSGSTLLFVNIWIYYIWITFQFVVWKVVSSHYSINVRYFWRNVNTIFFKQFIWKMSTYYCLSSPICFQTFSWIVGCILFDQILFKLHVGNHAILLLSVCPSCSSFNLKYFLLLHQYFLI